MTTASEEWKRNWIVPPAAALGYGLGTVYSFSFGTFIQPVEHDLGLGRGPITSALTIVNLIFAVVVPLLGRLIDRVGPWRLAVPGMIVYCIALAALGLAGGSVWSWWLLWSFVALAASVIHSPLWTTAVASTFSRARGAAFAVMLCGGGIMATVIPDLAVTLIDRFGWRGAYGAMAAILGLLTIPPVYFVFRHRAGLAAAGIARPVAPTMAEVRTDLLSVRYIKMAIAAFALMLVITSLLVHFQPILISKGVDRADAGRIAGLIGIGSLFGRLIFGVVIDHSKGPMLGVASFFLPLLVLVALYLFDGSITHACVTAFLLGLAVGSEVDILAYFIGRYFDTAGYATLFGVLVSVQNLAFALGPAAIGFLYDWQRSYDLFLLGAMPIVLLAVVIVATLGRYPARSDDGVLAT